MTHSHTVLRIPRPLDQDISISSNLHTVTVLPEYGHPTSRRDSVGRFLKDPIHILFFSNGSMDRSGGSSEILFRRSEESVREIDAWEGGYGHCNSLQT